MTEELTVQQQIDHEAACFRSALKAFGLKLEPKDSGEFIDGMERAMLDAYPQVTLNVKHMLTPGMYIRTIEMPAGSFLTSEIHKTDHPFVIHSGDISVWTEMDGATTLHAPFLGVTHPGTRRILFAHTDTVWSTFHATDKTEIEDIKKDIIMEHRNPLLERSLS